MERAVHGFRNYSNRMSDAGAVKKEIMRKLVSLTAGYLKVRLKSRTEDPMSLTQGNRRHVTNVTISM